MHPPYDFRRSDRVAKQQLSSLYTVHDWFARNLSCSLSACLRVSAAVRLDGVEQLPFAEFRQRLPSPTCIARVRMEPLGGAAVLEINPSLAYPMLQILLGGSSQSGTADVREFTGIERHILEGVLGIIVRELSRAWRPISGVQFSVETVETRPEQMPVFFPTEPLVAICFEITVDENRGVLNLGIPCIAVRMLGRKVEPQPAMIKPPGEEGREPMLQIVEALPVMVEARIEAGSIRSHELLRLEAGNVLALRAPVSKRVRVSVNGKSKLQGEIVAAGANRAVLIQNWE